MSIPEPMGPDQLGIASVLQHMIHVLAAAASLVAVVCIALVALSIITVARGRSESWTPRR